MVESIAQIKKIWDNTCALIEPFEFTFQDYRFPKLYASEGRIGKAVFQLHLYCHSYCLSWIIWSVRIHRTTAHERNWDSKNSWRQRTGRYQIIIERIFETGVARDCSIDPYCLVCHE